MQLTLWQQRQYSVVNMAVSAWKPWPCIALESDEVESGKWCCWSCVAGRDRRLVAAFRHIVLDLTGPDKP